MQSVRVRLEHALAVRLLYAVLIYLVDLKVGHECLPNAAASLNLGHGIDVSVPAIEIADYAHAERRRRPQAESPAALFALVNPYGSKQLIAFAIIAFVK